MSKRNTTRRRSAATPTTWVSSRTPNWRISFRRRSPKAIARNRRTARRPASLFIWPTGTSAMPTSGLPEAWQLFDHDKTLGRLARYERMRCFLNGGMPNTARLTFDEMYRAALEAGELPPLDDTMKKLPVIDDGPWGEVLLRAAGERTGKGRPGDAMYLAWQALAL